jgi:hypothetical protein
VNIRFIFITIALLCILALMWIILPMLEQKAMKDPYSAACPAGRYSVEGECVPLTSCKTDDDCWYLEKGTLPPRVGKCVDNMCHAYCGSGRVFECVN